MDIQSSTKPYLIHNGVIVLEANAAFCELFRCTPAGIHGQPIESIIASEDLRALSRLRGKHIIKAFDEEPERVFTQEYDFLRLDGTCFWGMAESRYIGPERYLTSIEWSYNVHES